MWAQHAVVKQVLIALCIACVRLYIALGGISLLVPLFTANPST